MNTCTCENPNHNHGETTFNAGYDTEARIAALIASRDDALDTIAGLRQELEDAKATIEHLRQSLARTQEWLTEASTENTELRTKVAERDHWLNAAAGTIERYGAKYGPLSTLD